MVVITVTPGGVIFTADLIRQLTFELRMDHISCLHRPGDTNNRSDIIFYENLNLQNQHVLVIDDAIESGSTMKRHCEYLRCHFEINSLAIATLFVKPSRVTMPESLFYAVEMDNDQLLIGYGLPWQDKFRNLPYISKLIK